VLGCLALGVLHAAVQGGHKYQSSKYTHQTSRKVMKLWAEKVGGVHGLRGAVSGTLCSASPRLGLPTARFVGPFCSSPDVPPPPVILLQPLPIHHPRCHTRMSPQDFDILQRLHSAGIPCPKPLHVNGKVSVTHSGPGVALSVSPCTGARVRFGGHVRIKLTKCCTLMPGFLVCWHIPHAP
jgi:hypothetical protein